MKGHTCVIEGKEVKVGDWVGFKCDIEQSGQVSKIEKVGSNIWLTLTNEYGFEGGYIGGQTVTKIHKADAWVD